MKINKIKAFTLLELSIVILIVGLLIGGVLVGEKLIETGQIRKNIAELQDYKNIVIIFKEKFGQLPGDYSSASQTLGCTAGSVNSGCNGNNDSNISPNGSAIVGQGDESMRSWQHLSLAGLTKGTFNGVATVATNQHTIGVTGPASVVEPGGYFLATLTYNSYEPDSWAVLVLGNEQTGGTLNTTTVRTPIFVRMMDEKIDNGLPKTGYLVANDGIGSTANTCVTAAAGNASTYVVTTTTRTCRLGLKILKR